jgi:hypothetical protein
MTSIKTISYRADPIWKRRETRGKSYLYVLCDCKGITTRLNTIGFGPSQRELEKGRREAQRLHDGWQNQWDGLEDRNVYIEESI